MPVHSGAEPLTPPFSKLGSLLLQSSRQKDQTSRQSTVASASLSTKSIRQSEESENAGLPLPVLYRDSQNRLQSVKDDLGSFVANQIDVSRLNLIHDYLWLAGRPMSARPLHRQKMMGRQIIVAEQADLHLTWIGNRIFVKPLPGFLLDYNFWEDHICADAKLHAQACGFIMSYTWLVCQQSDLHVAIDCGLFPWPLDWSQWVTFVEDVVDKLDITALDSVNKRYQYGELRLGRLNAIFRFAPELHFTHIMRGYHSQDTAYGTFFERQFAWLLILFVYINIMLSSAQVGLATDRLQTSQAFQRISYGLTMLFILLPVIFFILIFIWFSVLVVFHLCATLRFRRLQRHERKKAGETKQKTDA